MCSAIIRKQITGVMVQPAWIGAGLLTMIHSQALPLSVLQISLLDLYTIFFDLDLYGEVKVDFPY